MANINLSVNKLTNKLLKAVIILVSLHAFTLFLKFGLGRKYVHSIIPMFNMNEERNLPTFFSTAVILLGMFALWRTSRLPSEKQKGFCLYWKVLSAIFLFLALDESLSLHELWNRSELVNILPNANGFFHFAWVFPYLILISGVVLFFFKFLIKLPKVTALNMIYAGAIYVGGALGMEIIGGKYASIHSEENFTYYLFVTAEETMEMLGMIFFLSTILKYYLSNTRASEVKLAFKINRNNSKSVDKIFPKTSVVSETAELM